jgi:ABC-type uncharacterized transport system ATPase component
MVWILGLLELYHKVTFDGARRLILINTGEVLLDVQKRHIFGLEEWSILETNTKWFQALDTVVVNLL